MSHKVCRSQTRDKQAADFRRMQETPGDFAAAWPALSPSTPKERRAHFDNRAGLAGAFGEALPHPQGTRLVSKFARRVATSKSSVADRRKRS